MESIQEYISRVTDGAFDEVAMPLNCNDEIGEECFIEDSENHMIVSYTDLSVLESRAFARLITKLLNEHYEKLIDAAPPTQQEEVRHKVSDIKCANCKFSKRTEYLLKDDVQASTIRCYLNPPQVVVDHFEYPIVADTTAYVKWELGVCSHFEIDQVKLK